MKMFVLKNKLVIFGLLLVLFIVSVNCGKKYSKDLYDPLMLTRCDVKCRNLKKQEKNECTSICLNNLPKPGRCAKPNEMTAWESTCIKACVRDVHCPSMSKCCAHECGATCHEPRGLMEVPGLPSIPQKVTVSEKKRGRAVKVTWSSPENNDFSPISYVVEERHHVGIYFSESRLDKWHTRKRSPRPNTSLKNVVKPGRWYQFRVAAVNKNGTRGYSKPSAPFTPSHGPRPPTVPLNLTVSNLTYINGSLHGVLKWKPPQFTDLPIQKYKVYWSHRLQGVDQLLNSLVVEHQTVGKDQTSFRLKDLHPHSLYFLQVQALAPFGSSKLKSDKAALVLNTTNFSNESVSLFEGNSVKRSLEHRIEGLHFQRMCWMDDQLVAYISWRPVSSVPGNIIRYNVQWWTGRCGERNDYNNKFKTHGSAMTSGTKFKLHDLIFGCKYLIRVNKIVGDVKSLHSAEVTFKSPTYQQFKQKSDKMKCR